MTTYFEEDFRTEIEKSKAIEDNMAFLFWDLKDKHANLPILQKLVGEGYHVGAEPLFCSNGFLLHINVNRDLQGSFKLLPARVTDERGVWVEVPSPRKW